MFFSHAGMYGNQMEGYRGIARQYGLRLAAYEGGPDLDYTTGWDTAKMDAKRNPRMKQLLIQYWTDWFEGGNDGQFNLYAGGYSSDYTDVYAWAENIHDSSHVVQAVNQIMTTPNPALKTEWNIPQDTIDARKVYGWAECGDIYPCSYGKVNGSDIHGKYVQSCRANGCLASQFQCECQIYYFS